MSSDNSPFMQQYQGYFRSILKWEDLAQLWQRVRESAQPWNIYAPGEALPEGPSDPATLEQFLHELDQLLRHDHDYDYCGIVYADRLDAPTMIKVYDPNNLGSSCGSGSQPPPLPGWVLSHHAPCELQSQQILPGNRRRWWQRIFGG